MRHHNRRNVAALVVVFTMYLTTMPGCKSSSVPTIPERTKTVHESILENSWKTWVTIDSSLNLIYATLGVLHSNEKISDDTAREMIEVGKTIKASMETLKTSLEMYAEMIKNHEANDETKLALLDDLATILKNFEEFKNNVNDIYFSVTGEDLPLADIFTFSELLKLL